MNCLFFWYEIYLYEMTGTLLHTEHDDDTVLLYSASVTRGQS